MKVNGEPEPAEFADRQHRAREATRDRDLDALIVWSRGGTSLDFYGDNFYLANHHSPFPPNQDTPHWSGRSYSALVLPVDGDPTLVVDLPDYPADQIQIVDVRSTLKVPQTLASVLREKDLDHGRLGLVGRDTFLLNHNRIVESELGHLIEFQPADAILDRLRAIKSAAELRMIRRAAEVGVGWMNTMMEAVEPGRTEGEVVGEGLKYLAAHGGFPYDTAISSGPRAGNFFSRYRIPDWDSERQLERGDLVHIDAWGVIDGYFTDFVRSTVVGGDPGAGQLELLEGAVEIIDSIIQRVKPGETIGGLYRRGANWLTENGFGEHRGDLDTSGTDFGNLFPAFGHSFGVGLEPPWIIDGEPTVIEEGMCLAIEALVGRPGLGGAGFEQDVIVTPSGCDVITESCRTDWWT